MNEKKRVILNDFTPNLKYWVIMLFLFCFCVLLSGFVAYFWIEKRTIGKTQLNLQNKEKISPTKQNSVLIKKDKDLQEKELVKLDLSQTADVR